MSGGAPPGFNENVSMLSGGNSVQILKVMGGGGMSIPPSYNSSESVLQGGNSVPIVKVMGGGGSDVAQIEIYEPVVPESEKNAIASFLSTLDRNIYTSLWKEEFIRNYNSFKKYQIERFVVVLYVVGCIVTICCCVSNFFDNFNHSLLHFFVLLKQHHH